MKLYVILAATVSELLFTMAACACSCGIRHTDASAIEALSLAFVGTRTSSVTVLGTSDFGDGLYPFQRYEFTVDALLKGPPARTVTLTTTGGNCDFLFTTPGRYAVFAHYDPAENAFRATICSPTRLISSNDDPILANLGLKAASTRAHRTLEPYYRGALASTIFLALAIRHPLVSITQFERHGWLVSVARLLVLSSALSLVGLATARVRIAVKPLRLLSIAMVCITLALVAMYAYLRLSPLFDHHVF